MIGGSLLAAVAIAVLLLWNGPRTSRNVPVIIYLVDTLRADRLGVYGYTKPTSPGLDALAAESVVFDSAYAPAPWTLPSVASLVTSTFVCEHGVVSNRTRLGQDLPTLAGRLSDIGYVTGGIYANPYAGPKFGLERGYQHLSKAGQQYAGRGAVQRLLNKVGSTPTSADADQPFFLYIHTTEPHNPFNVPFRVANQFDRIRIEEKETIHDHVMRLRGLSIFDWANERAIGSTDTTALQAQTMTELDSMLNTVNLLYDSAVRWADANAISVVDILKQRGVWDKAIFIFLSDHGEELGDHGGWLHDQSVYEELARVPLLIHFPNDEFAGRRIDEYVSLIDIMPTIFDYLGQPELCVSCRGISLMPLIQDVGEISQSETAIVSIRENVMKYYTPWLKSRGDTNVVARRANWKAIWNDDIESIELYDLSQDPGELVNLRQQQAAIAEELRGEADHWLTNCQASAKGVLEPLEMDEETIDEFRALGYIN